MKCFHDRGGGPILMVIGDTRIDQEIYLQVGKHCTTHPIHLENIFKRWSHLHNSIHFFSFLFQLYFLFAASQWLLQSRETSAELGFIRHGLLIRVLREKKVTHHPLFSLKFCSQGFGLDVPAAFLTCHPFQNLPKELLVVGKPEQRFALRLSVLSAFVYDARVLVSS